MPRSGAARQRANSPFLPGSASFLLAPLGIGLAVIFVAAIVYHRAVLGRHYPA
jgi:hypothetical protein